MMWGLGFGWGWWGMLLGSLMMVVFWGAVILLIVWAVRGLGGASHAGTAPQTPLETAQRRYAAGEISRQEYEEIRRGLES